MPTPQELDLFKLYSLNAEQLSIDSIIVLLIMFDKHFEE
jgi:hypothetical protein